MTRRVSLVEIERDGAAPGASHVTDPLAPQPMTSEQIKDLVKRARINQYRLMIETQQQATDTSREAYRKRRSGR